MDARQTHLASLLKTLDVLKLYLTDIVIIGGWVPLLYRMYDKLPCRHPTLLTRDIDVAVPRKLKESGRPTIDALLCEAGYKARFYGSEPAPVTKYELSLPVTEVEFLTPEVGRPGKPSPVVQQGLTAQALRYLPILLENTLQIRVADSLPGLKVDLNVQVPSPAAFIYQKGLALPNRRSKIAKDLYYIFDLLDSSSESRDSIVSDLAILRGSYRDSWFKAFLRNLEQYFPESNAEGQILVASQYTGMMPEPTFRLYTHRVFRDFTQALRELS